MKRLLTLALLSACAPDHGAPRHIVAVPPTTTSIAAPTTTQPPPPSTVVRSSRAARTRPRGEAGPGRVASSRCGGDLPPCSVLACESGGNPVAENPTSSASGKWQIIDSTFTGTKAGRESGYGHAAEAPESVQDAAARELWAGGRGARHWKACLG